MKTYKIIRTYAAVGKAGDQVKLKTDRFTNQLLQQGIIAELKVVEPVETKTKTRTKKTA